MKDTEWDEFISTLLTSDEEVQIEANAREGFITEHSIAMEVEADKLTYNAAEYEEWERKHPNKFKGFPNVT